MVLIRVRKGAIFDDAVFVLSPYGTYRRAHWSEHELSASIIPTTSSFGYRPANARATRPP
jgi:hypothetical protein